LSVQTTLTSLSRAAASNGPDGSTDAPSTLDDQLRYHGQFIAEVRDGAHVYASSISGTNTITGTISTSPTAYVTGQVYKFISAGANTGAVTLNLNSIGAKSVTKNGTTALSGGEIQSGQTVLVMYDGTRFQILNPSPFVSGQVLQEVVLTDAGSSTTNSTLTNVTASFKPITPKSSNSTLVVECSFNGLVTAGGAGLNTTGGFRLYNSTASADIGSEATVGAVSASGANLQAQGACTVRASVANSGTTTINFLLRARYSTASCTVSATNQVWTIREIQN
jgi:hypothetical protein